MTYKLTYCLCCSDCCWNITINLRNFSSLFNNPENSYKGHIKRLVLNDASERNLELFFSLPKRFFTNLHRLVIIECEPIASVVGDILSDGRLTNLKQFYFQCKSLQVSCNISLIMESLFASHPNLVHIGMRNTVISSSDMLEL